jgi:glycosyltransferase involved in cell wall biosynthesis
VFRDPSPTTDHPRPLDRRLPRIGMVSTYPPTVCGLATFAAALVRQFERAGHRVDVVCLDNGANHAMTGGSVVARHVNGAPDAVRRTASALQHCDVVVLQHEYGIYGGADGDEVLSLLDAIQVPIVVVAHTVPLEPTNHQRAVLTAVCARADRVVVMTDTASQRLLSHYPVDPDIVLTIPHGAATPPPAVPAPPGFVAPELLTWGLLGPGKGIEHVIDALGELRHLGLRPRYTVAGVTHPNVLAEHGEAYRSSLVARAQAAGVADTVTFDASYRTVAELTRFIASASVVVLPYDSRDQVTSGVLVDAIAAGRPVIATAFPHAVELLSSGAGIIVPHGDVPALAGAIRTLVENPIVRNAMAAAAQRIAPDLAWPSVARRYLDLCAELTRTRQPVAM